MELTAARCCADPREERSALPQGPHGRRTPAGAPGRQADAGGPGALACLTFVQRMVLAATAGCAPCMRLLACRQQRKACRGVAHRQARLADKQTLEDQVRLPASLLAEAQTVWLTSRTDGSRDALRWWPLPRGTLLLAALKRGQRASPVAMAAVLCAHCLPLPAGAPGQGAAEPAQAERQGPGTAARASGASSAPGRAHGGVGQSWCSVGARESHSEVAGRQADRDKARACGASSAPGRAHGRVEQSWCSVGAKESGVEVAVRQAAAPSLGTAARACEASSAPVRAHGRVGWLGHQLLHSSCGCGRAACGQLSRHMCCSTWSQALQVWI